jgi:hypothetical protein
MLARTFIAAAVLLYLTVLGCVVLPGSTPAKKLSTEGQPDSGIPAPLASGQRPPGAMPYRGAAIQIQRVDWIDKYKKSIDEIAAVGCDTVSFVIDTRMENGHTSEIWLDMRMTPTPDKLTDLIQHAKSKGLRVIVMPIVLLDKPIENEWRGTIKPDYWPDWFDSYRSMLLHFAWICEQNKVDVMSVGSELVSSEKEKQEWTRTIEAVRGVFHGQLTYSANWDHYTSVPFWNQLDLIGMNSYYTLGEDKNVSVDEIVRRWRDIQKDLLSFQKRIGKPLLFLEVGWCSLTNAAKEPWNYPDESAQIDDDLQKRLYEGFFRAWYREPGLGGFVIWEWTCGDGGAAKAGPDGKEPTEEEAEALLRGYTPENKPAEKVLRAWLAKPWK